MSRRKPIVAWALRSDPPLLFLSPTEAEVDCERRFGECTHGAIVKLVEADPLRAQLVAAQAEVAELRRCVTVADPESSRWRDWQDHVLAAAPSSAQPLLDAVKLALDELLTGDERADLTAPEDPEVLAVCERLGFGAVMDSAARQWRKRDPEGAFAVGSALGLIRRARAALEPWTK